MATQMSPITWAWLKRSVEYGNGILPSVSARVVIKATRRHTNRPNQTNKATPPSAAGIAWDRAVAAQLVTRQAASESRSKLTIFNTATAAA